MAIQDKFNRPNVIYKITKDIDLGGGTLTIPEGCTLDFQGGSFSNGTIEGNDTAIKAINTVFYNILLKGNVANHVIDSKWFNFTGEYENDTPIFLNLIEFPKPIHFSSGVYAVSLSENIMVNGCNLIGIGGNSVRPVLKIKNSDNTSRFLLGLSYNCGVQNMYLSCFHDNRPIDVLRSDVYFGSTGVGHADRKIVLKDISIVYDRLWELPQSERSLFYSTALHFRHTDNNIYKASKKISNVISEGFAFRGSDFDNIQIKNFHEGIRITSGYNNTKMWINSIYFRNLEIWAGKGISFVQDEGCSNERTPYKVNVFSYMFQNNGDKNPDLMLGTDYYYTAGFWGKVDRLLILNYDYWDTDCRGVVSGTIFQSNVAGIFNKNETANGGWKSLDPENPPIVYDWRDMDGNSAISSKNTKTANFRSVVRPEWDGFSIRPSVDFTDIYRNPNSLGDNVYGKLYRCVNASFIEGIFDTDPYKLYKKETTSKEKSELVYSGEFYLKANGKELLVKPCRLENASENFSEEMEGIVYDKATRQFYIAHNKTLSDFRGSQKIMYNNYDSESSFPEKNPSFVYDDLNKIFSVNKHPHIIDSTTNYFEGSNYGPRRIETAPFGVWHKGTTRPSRLNDNTDVGFFFYLTYENSNKPMWWNGTEFVLADGSYATSYKYGSSFPTGKLADGFMFYNTQHSHLYIAKVTYPEGVYNVAWVGTDGYGVGNRKGESLKRPNLTGDDIGFPYYDTTLNKPIWWNGTAWVDATGATV